RVNLIVGANKKKTLLIICSVLLSVILLTMLTASGFIYWVFDYNANELQIDTCTENGGCWDYLLSQCLNNYE
ncbi:hypothetical protein, partial [Zooshikella harenae]